MKRTLLLLAALTLATNYIFAVNAGNRYIRYAKAIDKNGRLTHEGDTVRLRGIVQSVNMPSTVTTSYFFSIYDSTSSVTVYLARLKGGGKNGYNYTYTPALGDSVTLTGIVTMYTVLNGFTFDSTGFAVIAPLQAKGFDITQVNTGNPVHPALIVPGFKEKEESDLIEIDSVTLANPAQWAVPGRGASFGNVLVRNVNNPAKQYVLHVPSDVLGGKVPYGTLVVKGILYQQDSSAPYLNNYQLIPRTYNDITVIIPPVFPLQNIADVNVENALGIADSAGKLVHIKGIVQSTNLYPSSLGNGIAFSIFDKTGSILVYNTASNMGYTPTLGDSFFVEGTIKQLTSTTQTFPPKQFNTGWTYILPDSIAIPSNAHNMPLKAPIVTTGFDDSLESKLIVLKKVRLADTTQWDTTGLKIFNFYIPKYQMYVDLVDENNNYTRACILRIDSFFYMPKPLYEFNITGIEGQDTLTPAPKFSLNPRFVADIQLIPPTVPYYKISQVKGNDGNGVATSINKIGYLIGVVHSENLVSTGLKFSLIDATGAITVYSSTAVSAYTPMRGDSIITYGKIGQINGLTVIYPDSIKKINSYNPLQTTYVVSLLIEADESYPRRLEHVKLVSATQWNPAASAGTNGFSITVKDTASSDTFSVFISDATTAFKLPAPSGAFNVTGILQQSDQTSPFNTGYYLEPRDSQDIWMLSKGVEGIENQSANQIPVTIYPNPAAQNVHIQFGDLKGEAVVMNLYSATGILVYSEKVYGSSTMNISNLPQGMYFIKMTTLSGLQSSSKLIKE